MIDRDFLKMLTSDEAVARTLQDDRDAYRLRLDECLVGVPPQAVGGPEVRPQATEPYRTIVADPPWPYRTSTALVGNAGRGAEGGRAAGIRQIGLNNHYRTMPLADIKALSVGGLAARNAHLYLWTTNAFIEEAHVVARAWGFRPKTILTWVKTRKDDGDKPSMRTGYWFRSATEHVLFAVRGRQRLLGPSVSTAFFHPRLGHSVKPEAFFRMVEEQSPGPYLELFARRLRPGWDSWGDQIDSTIHLAS